MSRMCRHRSEELAIKEERHDLKSDAIMRLSATFEKTAWYLPFK